MPLPIPTNNDDKDSFIKRFMEDPKMIIEYPDEKQRYAVAESQWAGVDRYNASNVIDGYWMLSSEIVQPIETEQIIKVFPKGKYYIEKYKKEVDFNDVFFGDIATAFSSERLSKPKIDKDHEFKTSYGDIQEYQIKNDGMYFKIKLNQKGIDLVKNGEYNYISPAWARTKDTGNQEFPNRLLAVSLVNFPALEGALPSLQEQLRLSKFEIITKKKEEATKMEIFVLANELGLNSEASVEAVHKEIIALKKSNEDYKLKSETAETTAMKLSQEIKELKETELKKEAFESVRKWIELGKIYPAVQDIVIGRYILNKEATIKEMEMIPDNIYTGQRSNNTDTTGLSKEISDKMVVAGLDPKSKEDIEIALTRWGGK